MSTWNSDADAKAWLAKAKQGGGFMIDGDYGEGSPDYSQGNPTSKAITGAGRDASSDGSLDSNQ